MGRLPAWRVLAVLKPCSLNLAVIQISTIYISPCHMRNVIVIHRSLLGRQGFLDKLRRHNRRHVVFKDKFSSKQGSDFHHSMHDSKTKFMSWFESSSLIERTRGASLDPNTISPLRSCIQVSPLIRRITAQTDYDPGCYASD